MWESKIAKIKSDEYIILRVKMEGDEVMEMEYLTSNSWRSRWKSDARVYFTEDDAKSALVIKRMRWEEILKEPENPSQKEYDSWSQLSSHW